MDTSIKVVTVRFSTKEDFQRVQRLLFGINRHLRIIPHYDSTRNDHTSIDAIGNDGIGSNAVGDAIRSDAICSDAICSKATHHPAANGLSAGPLINLDWLDRNQQRDKERIEAQQTERNGEKPRDHMLIVCHRYSHQTPSPRLPTGDTPSRLIVLSDCHSEQTIVDTLENGAHHYFDLAESDRLLSARLAAVMRNHQYNSIDVLEVFPFKFFVERRKVTHGGKPIHLSPREFALAYFLFANNSRVVVDSELMVSIWTLPSSMDSRRIDTAICRIRKKMNLYENASGWNLQRLRQVGYQLLYENTPASPTYLPDLSKCLIAPRAVSVHDHAHGATVPGNTSCNVLASNSTISDNSMSLAMNGGASST